MKKKIGLFTAGLLLLGAMFSGVIGTRVVAQDQNVSFLRSVEIITENAYLWLGKSVTIWFEGATTDAFQTNLVATDPTADRTIYLPNQSGILMTGKAGSTTLDGSNPTTVATGITGGIISCNVSFRTSAALGDDPNSLSVTHPDATVGNLNIYAWKNTNGTDPTQVASTDSAMIIDWQCSGT